MFCQFLQQLFSNTKPTSLVNSTTRVPFAKIVASGETNTEIKSQLLDQLFRSEEFAPIHGILIYIDSLKSNWICRSSAKAARRSATRNGRKQRSSMLKSVTWRIVSWRMTILKARRFPPHTTRAIICEVLVKLATKTFDRTSMWNYP